MTPPLLATLISFVIERELIRQRRAEGGPPPWTPNPILQKYRFCNINREDDAVTRWIDIHIRQRYCSSIQEAVRQLLVARFFNEPKTLERIIPVTDFTVAEAELSSWGDGRRLFRGAYMMPTHPPGVKGEQAFRYWLRVAREASLATDYAACNTLAEVASALMESGGIGPFIANQVCTDLRYCPLWGRRWKDWGTFILAGPGTCRGLNRVHNRPLKSNQCGALWAQEVRDLRGDISEFLPDDPPYWFGYFTDPNNMANTLCEFDKYMRASDATASGDKVRLRRFKQSTSTQ